jgi:hypothetical protein
MDDYTPRIPVEDEYLSALGRATYNFTYLEWGIVWLTETLDPGFLRRVRSLTAGQIAREFQKQVKLADPSVADKKRLSALASTFESLTGERNALLHGNPYTANGGEQRLLYNGKHGRRDWTIPGIVEAARSFEEAAIEAGQLLHGGLYQSYCDLMKR